MSRIALFISRFDHVKLQDWIDCHAHLNCGSQHNLHVIIPRSLESVFQDSRAELENIFQSVEAHYLEVDPMGGWPYAPNAFFWHAARFMSANPASPWQVTELDCLPLYTNSYDGVASQHSNCGSPFYGNVSPTPWRITDEKDPNYGKITVSRFGKEDVMMSGCGVYPGNIFQRPNFASKDGQGLMADFMKGQDSTDEPWDMHLAPAMRADGLIHTEAFAQHWNTGNYRVVDGTLVCEALKDHEIYRQHPDWERRDCGGKVSPQALFVHGCKDDSLFKLILNDEIPGFVHISKRERSASVQSAIVAPQSNAGAPDKVSALEAKVDDLASMFKQFMQISAGQAAQSKAAPPISSPTASGATTEEKVAGGNSCAASGSLGQTGHFSGEGIWPKIKQMLAIQKWRLGDLASAVDLPKDQLKTLLESKGYEMRIPAQWVKKAELQPA